MFTVVKVTSDSVYLRSSDGSIRKVFRETLDFKPVLGDEVELYTIEDELLIVKAGAFSPSSSERELKMGLIRGILDLFLETLAIQNNHLSNVKKVLSQLWVTIFMTWSLVGVMLLSLLLLLESVIVLCYQLLVKAFRSLNLREKFRNLSQMRNANTDRTKKVTLVEVEPVPSSQEKKDNT